MFRWTAVGKAGRGRGSIVNTLDNGRPRAESPSGVAADTLTVAFHAADSLSGSFFGGRRTDASRVLFLNFPTQFT